MNSLHNNRRETDWLQIETDFQTVIDNSKVQIAVETKREGFETTQFLKPGYQPKLVSEGVVNAWNKFWYNNENSCSANLKEYLEKDFTKLEKILDQSEKVDESGIENRNPIAALQRLQKMKIILTEKLPAALKEQDVVYEPLNKECKRPVPLAPLAERSCAIAKKIEEKIVQIKAKAKITDDQLPSPVNVEANPHDNIVTLAFQATKQVRSIATTGVLLAANKLFAEPQSDPILNMGAMTHGHDMNLYLDHMIKESKQDNISLIHGFAWGGVNNATVVDLLDRVKKLKKEMQDAGKWPLQGDAKIIIPVCIGQNSALERSHIVLLTVEKDAVFYFDSKGTSSKSLHFSKEEQGNFTLYKFIEMVRDALVPGKEIVENTNIMQTDINNCAIYLLACVRQRIVYKHPFKQIFNDGIDMVDIKAVREHIAELKAAESNPKAKEESIEDGFDDDWEQI